MKYANFLMFGFLLAFSQSSFSKGYETVYSCAQILVYGQEYTDFEDERFDEYCDVVAYALEEKFSDSELLKYEEALLQPEMQKMLFILKNICGGAYNFPSVFLYRLFEALRTNKYMMSSEALCLNYNQSMYEKSLQEQEDESQDYYKQIIDWFFDYESLRQSILERQCECAAMANSELLAAYGWSEKTMLLSQQRTKINLSNYYYYSLMLDALKNSMVQTLKEVMIESDISAHEIIKIHKFLYSSLGRKALTVHKECVEEITKELLETVQL